MVPCYGQHIKIPHLIVNKRCDSDDLFFSCSECSMSLNILLPALAITVHCHPDNDDIRMLMFSCAFGVYSSEERKRIIKKGSRIFSPCISMFGSFMNT